jgi:hypothetical protein
MFLLRQLREGRMCCNNPLTPTEDHRYDRFCRKYSKTQQEPGTYFETVKATICHPPPFRRSVLDSFSVDASPAMDRRHPALVALCSLLRDSGELPYLRQLMLMRASVGSVMSNLF